MRGKCCPFSKQNAVQVILSEFGGRERECCQVFFGLNSVHFLEAKPLIQLGSSADHFEMLSDFPAKLCPNLGEKNLGANAVHYSARSFFNFLKVVSNQN